MTITQGRLQSLLRRTGCTSVDLIDAPDATFVTTQVPTAWRSERAL
jgi:hypothetical protein